MLRGSACQRFSAWFVLKFAPQRGEKRGSANFKTKHTEVNQSLYHWNDNDKNDVPDSWTCEPASGSARRGSCRSCCTWGTPRGSGCSRTGSASLQMGWRHFHLSENGISENLPVQGHLASHRPSLGQKQKGNAKNWCPCPPVVKTCYHFSSNWQQQIF